MFVIPTYDVRVKHHGNRYELSVPKTELDAFLRVLTFNDCEFEVNLRRPFVGTGTTGLTLQEGDKP
jgi:hypothetical protein